MRTSAIALMSTTLEIKNIRKAELHGSLRSFKSLIKEGYGANKYPELFCFGLLEYFDVPELMKLATVAGKQRIFFQVVPARPFIAIADDFSGAAEIALEPFTGMDYRCGLQAM